MLSVSNRSGESTAVVQSVLSALGTVRDRPVAERGFGVTSGSSLGWKPFEGEACWDRGTRVLPRINWAGGEVLFARQCLADIWPTLDGCCEGRGLMSGRSLSVVMIFSDWQRPGSDGGTGTRSWRTLAGKAT